MSKVLRIVKPKRRILPRIGDWLRSIVRKEQLADPQWREQAHRERMGQMGENLEPPVEISRGRS